MYNDYELVAMAQEHNEEATNILYDKYRPLLVSKAKDTYKYLINKGVELSDIIQEAMIGFEEAIDNFNQDDSALFYTFACICVDRQLKSVLLKFSRDKHKILNEAISLDNVETRNGEEVNILNFIIDETDNPEYGLLSQEATRELLEEINGVLTDFELQVFNLRIKGYVYTDIAKILNKDVKSIDNTLQRIKNKLKKIRK